ncbi:MAG: hypothetical protein K2Y21_03260 [Phycisphaerales bacterium]|nr:hypothetical protein [Phycisphaerales bacterium]
MLAAAVVAGGAVAWTSSNWWNACQNRAKAESSLREIAALIERVNDARAMPVVLFEETHTVDHLSMVSDALGRAGIAGTVLRRVQPEGERGQQQMLGVGLPIRRVGMRVELERITLPEIGRFLAAWRFSNPAWIPVLINLTPHTQREESEAEQIPQWSLGLSIAAVYLTPPRAGVASAATEGSDAAGGAR